MSTDDDLTLSIRDALETLLAAGHDVESVFGDRSLEVRAQSADVAYAIGTIDGAGVALGLTAIELLYELRLLPES